MVGSSKLTLRSLAGAALFVCCATWTAGSTERQANLTPDVDRVVEGLAFKIGKSPTEYLTKWDQAVHVGLVLDRPIPPQLLAKFGETLSAIQNTTRHELTVSGNANFLVIFSSSVDEAAEKNGKAMAQLFADQESYQRFLTLLRDNHKTCGTRLLLTSHRSIGAYLLVAFIPNGSNPMDAEKCLVRGLLKGMGLMGGWSPGNQDFFVGIRQ